MALDDEYGKVKAWYLSRSVYVATAIGFGLGVLVMILLK